MSALLSIQQVRKKYCRSLRRSLLYGVQDIFSDLLFRNPDFGLREDEFLALDDVSFDVSPGESVALIGRNGAGKSTLLKLINGLFSPDAGMIKVNGSVAALIELGAGFNPILSGRENIYINGAVLGISKTEVDRQLEEIVDFAELDEFIDTPLKSYSSGMKVRLGFAVASQLRPDLLLIDEVLAVGDAAFRAKCYRRLASLLNEGTAFVLVSHNKHMLLNTCSRGLVLDHGAQVSDEPITEALDTYERLSGTVQGIELETNEGSSSASISQVQFHDASGEPVREPKTGAGCELNIEVNVREKIDAANIALIVRGSQAGEPLLALSSLQEGYAPLLEPGCHQVQLRFDHFPFIPGNYHCKLSISDGRLNVLDAVDNFSFGVSTGAPAGDSAFYSPHSWQNS